MFRSVGEWLRIAGPLAVRRPTVLRVLLQINKFDGWDMASLDYLRLGPVLIELGDVKGYEPFPSGSHCPLRRHHVSGGCGTRGQNQPAPASGPENHRVLWRHWQKLAAKSFANVAPGNTNAEAVFQAAWGSLSVALMEYRQGNYAKAEEWCRRCLAYPGDNPPRVATARVILAMSCHQLGQNQEAISQLAQGRESIEAQIRRWSGSRQRRAWFLVRLGLRPHSVT